MFLLLSSDVDEAPQGSRNMFLSVNESMFTDANYMKQAEKNSFEDEVKRTK